MTTHNVTKLYIIEHEQALQNDQIITLKMSNTTHTMTYEQFLERLSWIHTYFNYVPHTLRNNINYVKDCIEINPNIIEFLTIKEMAEPQIASIIKTMNKNFEKERKAILDKLSKSQNPETSIFEKKYQDEYTTEKPAKEYIKNLEEDEDQDQEENQL